MTPDGEEREEKSDSQPLIFRSAKYIAIGLEFPAMVGTGLFLGYFLDLYFRSSPWLVMIMGLLAVIAALARLVVILRHFSKGSR